MSAASPANATTDAYVENPEPLRDAAVQNDPVPDAEVQLVAYRRRAEALSPGFVSATKLDALLAALRKDKRLEPGNGSALEEGARVAAEQLKGRAGERRIAFLCRGN